VWDDATAIEALHALCKGDGVAFNHNIHVHHSQIELVTVEQEIAHKSTDDIDGVVEDVDLFAN
jgi:hypothetical protein